MKDTNNTIKSYTEYRTDFDTKKKYPYLRKHFRRNGQLELVEYYIRTGKCFSQKVYKFDAAGNKIKEILTGDYLESEKWLHTFNQQNQRIESYFYKNDILEDYYKYHFNEKGQCVEELQCNHLKELEIKTTYLFNDKGKIIEEYTYNADSNLIETITSTYNDNNQLSRYDNFIYNDDKTIEEYFYIVYFYKKTQKLEKQESFSYYQGGTKPTKEIEWYNENEEKIKTLKYNEQEELTEEFTYQYEYDVFKNWIKKSTFKFGQIAELSTREYVYYDTLEKKKERVSKT